METKNIDELYGDPMNPQRMDVRTAKVLKESLSHFGDLGSIVFNVRTQMLVGGHKRIATFKMLPGDRRVVITNRYEAPDEVGTVGIGWIFVGNKQFAYREVDWDLATQRAANIAANNINGEADDELLAEVNMQIAESQNGAELLALTGQTDEDLAKLAGEFGPEEEKPNDDPRQSLSLKFTDAQLATVYDAIGKIKHEQIVTNDIENSDYDAVAILRICEAYSAGRVSQL